MGKSKKKQIKTIFRKKTQKGGLKSFFNTFTAPSSIGALKQLDDLITDFRYGGIYQPVNDTVKNFLDNNVKRAIASSLITISKGTIGLVTPRYNDFINARARTGALNLLNSRSSSKSNPNFKFSYPHIWLDVTEKNETARVFAKYNKELKSMGNIILTEAAITSTVIEDTAQFRKDNPLPNDLIINGTPLPEIVIVSDEEIQREQLIEKNEFNSGNLTKLQKAELTPSEPILDEKEDETFLQNLNTYLISNPINYTTSAISNVGSTIGTTASNVGSFFTKPFSGGKKRMKYTRRNKKINSRDKYIK